MLTHSIQAPIVGIVPVTGMTSGPGTAIRTVQETGNPARALAALIQGTHHTAMCGGMFRAAGSTYPGGESGGAGNGIAGGGGMGGDDWDREVADAAGFRFKREERIRDILDAIIKRASDFGVTPPEEQAVVRNLIDVPTGVIGVIARDTLEMYLDGSLFLLMELGAFPDGGFKATLERESEQYPPAKELIATSRDAERPLTRTIMHFTSFHKARFDERKPAADKINELRAALAEYNVPTLEAIANATKFEFPALAPLLGLPNPYEE